MNKHLLALLSLFLLWPLCARADFAAASAWQRAPEVGVRLIAGVTATGEGDTLPLGLDIDMADGWKTYWRFPGVAGYPVKLDWTASSPGPVSAEVRWPAPHRFDFSGLQSFGYKGHVILPLTAHLAQAGGAVQLRVAVDLMVCAEVCIPQTFDLALDLPAGPASPSAWAADLARWDAQVPGDGMASGLSILGAQVAGESLQVTVSSARPLGQPDLFVETAGGMVLPAPEVIVGTPVQLRLPLKAGAPSLVGQDVTLTLVDGDRSVEKRLQVTAPVAAATTPAMTPAGALPMPGLWAALLAAFIGGLILNLMPCVLPVLSLKLLSVLKHGNSPPAHVRVSFLASAAGILSSFLVLAGLAIGFRAAGEAVGWGVQFQHPIFLGVMVLVLTLFAASLWDLIHIPLPRFLTDALVDRLPEPGHHDSSVLGHFLTGAFTTLLATPCSAPFVGTAIGFALAGSNLVLLLVAVIMGLGLATPFLLVAAFPRVAGWLPRPGRWMIWLRGVFGVALMVSALWLASVLGTGQTGTLASVLVGSVFLILFVLWIRASIQRPFLLVKGIVFITIGIYVVRGLDALEQTYRLESDAPQINWVAFDESAIPGLVASGKVVFVDVMAGWCLTCKANKVFVLDAEPTLTRLRAPGVVTMQADWTHRNPAISAYLRVFGRYGIPFDVVYGPGAPHGIPLPELLTAESVRMALEKAALNPETD